MKFLLFIFALAAPGLAAPPPLPPVPAPQSLEQALELWQSTERAVRDSHIRQAQARHRFIMAYRMIKERSQLPPPTPRWTFPLLGYGPRAFTRDSYQPKGFNYYLGTKAGAIHPAVDIFARDRRERAQDDRTGKPIVALAAFDGIVVSMQPAWKKGDPWRGGVYVYIMEPATGRLAYYAHLRQPWVELGQVLKPGEIVGEVGRTGTNAYKRRSKTHLHLMYMGFSGRTGDFWVLNPIHRLNTAKTVSYQDFGREHPGFLSDPRWGR